MPPLRSVLSGHTAAFSASAVPPQPSPSRTWQRRRLRGTLLALLALLPGCARFGFEDLGLPGRAAGAGGSPGSTGSAELDAAAPSSDASQPALGAPLPDGGASRDAGSPLARDADAEPTAPAVSLCTLSAPELLGSPNFPGNDLWSPSPSADGLSLFFAVLVPGWVEQIAVSVRSTPSAAFGDGQSLPAPVNTNTEGTPALSADGLSLYFFSERAGGAGGRDLYLATRSSTSAQFDTVRALVALNTPEREHLPRVSADELTLHFVSNRSGDTEIWRATRASRTADFEAPQLVPELNSDSEDGAVTLSPDGLEAILSSNRAGTLGGRDLYRATRGSSSEPFSTPEPLTELNSAVNDYDPTLSFDGTELYFVSNRNGSNSEVYRSRRSCP